MSLFLRYITYLLLIGVGFILRVYKLNTVGFFDYDSAKNYQILESLSEWDFTNLFHHSSPSFYLLLLPFYELSDNFIYLEWVCSVANVLSVLFAVKIIQNIWKLDFITEIILFILISSSTFLLVSSRYLAIESLTIFFFNWSLFIYFNRNKSNRYWILFCILIAITFTINYKTVLFFSFLAVVELFYWNDEGLGKRLFVFFIVIVSILIGYSILGFILDLPFIVYFKHLYIQIFARNPNPEKTIPLFNFDVLFYIKYIFQFENVAVLLGFSLLLYKRAFKRNYINNSNEKSVFLLLIIFFFIIMSLLAKAPRGLLFIYSLFFALGYWQLLELLKNRLLKVLFASICLTWNIWQINRHVYQYSSTNYNEVAITIENKNINSVKTSVGLTLTAFTGDNVYIKPVFHADSLNDYQGFFLRDSYWKVAKIGSFDKVKGEIIKKWNEPSLCSPFLYLESCEYNGNSYEQALKDWESAKRQKYHLELLKLN